MSDYTYDDYGGYGEAPAEQPHSLIGDVIEAGEELIEDVIEGIEHAGEAVTGPHEPFPVRLIPATRPHATEFAGWQTYTLTAGQAAVQVLRRQRRRRRAVLVASAIPIQAEAASKTGNVLNPAAFTAITTTGIIPAGWYTVTATASLAGVITAADANNMFIGGSGNPLAMIIPYPAVANVSGTLTAVIYFNGSGNAAVLSLNASSGGGVTYTATINVVPLINQFTAGGLIVGSVAQCSQGTQTPGGPGGYLAAGVSATLENQRELYAVLAAGSQSGMYLSVLDETYNE